MDEYELVKITAIKIIHVQYIYIQSLNIKNVEKIIIIVNNRERSYEC